MHVVPVKAPCRWQILVTGRESKWRNERLEHQECGQLEERQEVPGDSWRCRAAAQNAALACGRNIPALVEEAGRQLYRQGHHAPSAPARAAAQLCQCKGQPSAIYILVCTIVFRS